MKRKSTLRSPSGLINYDQAVGLAVDQHRKVRGFTQAEIAGWLGLSPTTVGRKLAGHVPWFSQEVAIIEQGFGVSAGALTPVSDGNGGWLPAPFVPGKAKAPAFAGASVRHGGLEPSTRWLQTFEAFFRLFVCIVGVFEQERQERQESRERYERRQRLLGQERQRKQVRQLRQLNCWYECVSSLEIMKHVLALDVPTAAWRESILDWEKYLVAGGRSGGTIYLRVSHVRRLARNIEVDEPRNVLSHELLMWCASQPWAADTRHSYYVSFRQFFGFLFGPAGGSPADILPAVHRKPGISRPTPEMVIHDALSQSDERLQMIIRLGVEVGLRGFEIAKVHERDVQADLLGFTLVVRGKGDKERSVPLAAGFAQRLVGWCQSQGGYAFPGNQDGHLSRKWVSKLVSRVLPSPWTLHTLRHRFANAAYQRDRDITAVQDLLGHSKLDTTRNYIATDRKAMRVAAMGAQLGISGPPTEWTISTEPPIVLSFIPSRLRAGSECVPLTRQQITQLAAASSECLKLHQEPSN